MARNIEGQVSDAATPGLPASSIPLVDNVFVRKPGPRSSKNLMSTVRTLGMPWASTVATERACGSGTSAWAWNASCLEITSVSNCDNTFKVSVKNIGNAAGEFAWQLGIGVPQGTDIPKGATLSQNFVKGDVVNIRWGKDNELVKTLEFVQPKDCPTATTSPAVPPAPPAAGPNDLPVTGASLGAPIGVAGVLLVGGVVGFFLVQAKRRRTEAANQ